MSQGWVVNSSADTITFNEAPPVGVNNVVVTETATSSVNATDVWAFGAWNPGFGYPAEVEFFGDRLGFAATDRQPQTAWFSKSGQYPNFGRSVPLIDDDALNITINARQVNRILDLVPLSDLILMTPTCEWRLTTDDGGVLAPGKNGFKPQTFWGAHELPALVIGESALFLQRSGSVIRDTAFTFTDDKYKGNNLSVYAAHLFAKRQIVDWAFQQHPYSAVWMVRNDGKLICLTYVREQEVVAFTLCETQGLAKRVCVVPEGNTDVLYVTFLRTTGGVDYLSTERMVPRDLEDQRDAFFVDAGLTYDGRAQAGTATLSGGVDWTTDQALTLTIGGATPFVGVSDVGDQVRLRLPVTTVVNGDEVLGYDLHRVEIIAYIAPGSVTVRPLSTVPVAFRNVAIADWEIMRDTVSGLGHLEGQTVAVLADAAVQEQKVVVGGAISLDHPAAVVHVGLPFTSLLESLDINVPGNETVRDKPKLIRSVTLLVQDTRGCKAGPDTGLLDEMKVREFEDYEDPLALVTGILDVSTSGTWDRNGRFIVVQEDPLPVTILSLIPDVAVAP